MAKYRKKPVVIEAVQFDGTSQGRNAVLNFTGLTADNAKAVYWREANGGEIVIRTLEGDMTASAGDWIIRGVQGELYPCKPPHLRCDLRAR